MIYRLLFPTFPAAQGARVNVKLASQLVLANSQRSTHLENTLAEALAVATERAVTEKLPYPW